eukprot:CAMPEP_0174253966 /NCGR_PEP_ID=MMETSP0439-20130205/3325_1 /TAXON_ID=0 /ORGANISM="Stereomyxa ramosa, Strain Chinc5" /LENGTH=987 /DNA_ID=CAMNT_0015335303 /DNA_START=51 /DNA_END=3011 /DNA_ORIENTATION=-
MASIILKVKFPAGSPKDQRVMKLKAENSIEEIIKKIVEEEPVGEAEDFLILVPGDPGDPTNNPSKWASNKDTLGSFNLPTKAVIHLKSKFQIATITYCGNEEIVKTILLDWTECIRDWLPILGMKFDREDYEAFDLYVAGKQKPLNLDQSLLQQGVLPEDCFEFRQPREDITRSKPTNGRTSNSKKARTVGANSRGFIDAKGKEKLRSIVDFNASVKSLKNPDKDGFVTVNYRKRWDKRWAVLHSEHLFLYKSKNDSKPVNVIELKEFVMKPLNEGNPKKKFFALELVPVRSGTLALDGKPESSYVIKKEKEEERQEWVDQIQGHLSKVPRSISFNERTERKPLAKESEAPVSTKLFGVPLVDVVAAKDGSELPAIVEKCVNYLEMKDRLKTEGIFRLSGSAVLIEKYVERFDTGEDVDLSEEKDPHAVAGLLKLYFRDLPEPLLTYELYPSFLAATCTKDRAVVLRYVKHLVQKLPPVNLALLDYLLSFLRRVSEYSEINKMALHNLATVFAPNLLRKQQSNAFGMVVDTPMINSIVNTLISEYDYIFEDLPIEAHLTEPGTAARCCRALYDYKGESDEELNFEQGNIIKIIQERKDGWWIGVFKGSFGRFPASYVKKWSAKQSESFTERQKVKQEENKLRKQHEDLQQEIQELEEKREKMINTIDNIQRRKHQLNREFFSLKKALTPVLQNAIEGNAPSLMVGEEEETEEDEKDEKGKKGKKEKKKKEKKPAKEKKKVEKKPSSQSRLGSTPSRTRPSNIPTSSLLGGGDLDGKSLEIFPRAVDEFLKESIDHRKALDGVDQSKDNFLTSVEMLLGALPVAKRERKKWEPLRYTIENIKNKTKTEAYVRDILSIKKDIIIRDLTEIQGVLNNTVSKQQFEFGDEDEPAVAPSRPSSSGKKMSPHVMGAMGGGMMMNELTAVIGNAASSRGRGGQAGRGRGGSVQRGRGGTPTRGRGGNAPTRGRGRGVPLTWERKPNTNNNGGDA